MADQRIYEFIIRQGEVPPMDRPPEDADAEEIARFLENDFWEQVSTGVEGTVKEQPDGGSDKSSKEEEND